MISKPKRDGPPKCSFCGKPENHAGELIASPLNDNVQQPACYICFACIAACKTIVDHPPEPAPAENAAPPVVRANCDRVTHNKYSVRFGPLPRVFTVTQDPG